MLEPLFYQSILLLLMKKECSQRPPDCLGYVEGDGCEMPYRDVLSSNYLCTFSHTNILFRF